VIPAPKLAETKGLGDKGVRDFEAAVTDEERHRGTLSDNKDTKVGI
jgi:hypothetical protein